MKLLRAALTAALAPTLSSTTSAARGFSGAQHPVARQLDKLPQAVVTGFEWAMTDSRPLHLGMRLELCDVKLRGFISEGITMALAIRQTMGARPSELSQYLETHGKPYTLLNYIGLGFALAKLPRPAWSRVHADADLPYPDAKMWLAVDGLGFDRAYFNTEQWVVRQKRPDPDGWAGDPDYFPHAFDQGVGRALWFIEGADTDGVDRAVRRFAPSRQADLWSGVGIAAVVAGGAGHAELDRMQDNCAQREHLAQGATFGALAREMANDWTEETSQVVATLTRGLDVPGAAALTSVTEPTMHGARPKYERWREALRNTLAQDTLPLDEVTAAHE